MSAADILVIVAAVAALAGLGWFFFGPRKAKTAVLAGGVQRLEVTVKGGYSPEVLRVRQGVPVELTFDRQESGDCTSRVVFPDFRVSAALPAWQRTTVRLDPGETGEFGFACGMNMIHGTLIVEPAAGGVSAGGTAGEGEDQAAVIRDGEVVEVTTAEVVAGDLLLVRPGDKIAVDGVVEEGRSEVDESVVTGESLPVSKAPGSPVIGATINKNGTLRVRATKVGADTALAQIVKLVQEAQNSKAPGQRLADRAAFWLVFVALIGGAVTLLAWLGAGRSLATAMLFAITVVVITCPDALGLATPTAIMVGTGLGAKRGILFKNAMALETSARISAVVMDKTGTLTKGEPEVTGVVADALPEREVLRLAAAVERESEHPLAEAVVKQADGLGVPAARAEGFENVPGHGALAQVDGRTVAVGNTRLMQREGIDLGALAGRREEMASAGQTVVWVAVGGRAVALIGIADAPRPTSAAAVAALAEAGVEVVMLTGDNQATAQRIAAQLGVPTVIAEVLPGDKAGKIAELQQTGKSVAMVGDGVNDAPALAQADLGIAIGAGTDVAIETADVVLMRSDPLDVPTALEIGRGTLRKMRQNLGWAIGYNSVALPIAAGVFEPAFGLVLRPEIAALSMSGSSFLVAVNALLLRRLRLPGRKPGRIAGVPGGLHHARPARSENPDCL